MSTSCDEVWGDSTQGRLFALYTASPSSIPATPYGPLNLPGVISECRTLSNARCNTKQNLIKEYKFKYKNKLQS